MLQSASSQTEYILYAYDFPEAGNTNSNKWLRLTSSSNVDEIQAKAEGLFETKKYQKIEIKKKVYDSKKGRHRAKIFRTYEVRNVNNYWILASIFLLTSVSAGYFYLKFGAL